MNDYSRLRGVRPVTQAEPLSRLWALSDLGDRTCTTINYPEWCSHLDIELVAVPALEKLWRLGRHDAEEALAPNNDGTDASPRRLQLLAAEKRLVEDYLRLRYGCIGTCRTKKEVQETQTKIRAARMSVQLLIDENSATGEWEEDGGLAAWGTRAHLNSTTAKTPGATKEPELEPKTFEELLREMEEEMDVFAEETPDPDDGVDCPVEWKPTWCLLGVALSTK